MKIVSNKDANKVAQELVSRFGWIVENRRKHVVISHPTEPGRRRTLPHGAQRICREALKDLRKELRICEEESLAKR